MKPTLYADDPLVSADPPADVLLARVLPRHCPANCDDGTYYNYAPPGIGEPLICDGCIGAGFLYPDPPDSASVYAADRVSGSSDRAIGFVDWKPEDWIDWHRFCRLLWRQLGIVGYTS